MRTGSSLRSYLVALLCLMSVPAMACEPILPMMRVLAGPNWMIPSFAGLLAVVFFKSVAFACYEKRLPVWQALLFMFAANIATSLVGTVVAVIIAAPVAVIALPLIFVLSRKPAKRLKELKEPAWLARIHEDALALFVVGLLFVTYVLFGIASGMVYRPGAGYWIMKVLAVYGALAISMALTTFWEEYIVSSVAEQPNSTPVFYPSVLRANLMTFLVAAGIGAAMMLPRRFASADFLVSP